MSYSNEQIADHLAKIAELYGMKEDDQRVFAFGKAEKSVRYYPTPLEKMQLGPGSIKHVGPSTVSVIQEFLKTGTSKRLTDLQVEVGVPPPEVQELTKIPGVGLVTATKLWKEHNITSMQSLGEALESGKLQDDKLKKAFEYARDQATRIPLTEALAIATPIVEKLKSFQWNLTSSGEQNGRLLVQKIELAGSLRRRKETVKDVDILVATKDDFDRHYLREIIRATWPEDVYADGETRTRLRISNRQVDIIYTTLDSWGAALCYLTGSQNHNIRIREFAKTLHMKVSEYDVLQNPGTPQEKRIFIRNEHDLYDTLGIWYIQPTKREDTVLLEKAIQLRDLKTIPGMTFEQALELREKHGITTKTELDEWVKK